MRKLILITGELAAGKSTLARAIAVRYRIPAFTKDRIKELLCERLGFCDRTENLKLSFLTFDLLLEIFSVFAASGQPLVLESNFRQNELDRLETVVRAAGYETLTISLTGDLNKLYERYHARAASGTRHPAHLSQDLSDFSNFSAVSCAQNPRRLFGTVLTFDTTAEGTPADLSRNPQIAAFLSGLKNIR